MRLSILILTAVNVAIRVDVCTLPMLQAELPFTFIPIPVFPLVNAVSVGFALGPLTDVRIAKDALPDALALFETQAPLSFVDLSVEPRVNTFAVWFVILELAFVFIAVAVAFETSPVPVV